MWEFPPPHVVPGKVILGFGVYPAVDGQEAHGWLFGIADKSY